MCGIIGIVGAVPVQDRLIESLKRLEYRGYDSAGIAAQVGGRIERRRAPGKLRELEQTVRKTEYTQLFMETPYRNRELIREIAHTVNPELWLGVAWDITGTGEEVKTRRVGEWKTWTGDEQTDKRPAVFILGNG